jgi:hypothetical protein
MKRHMFMEREKNELPIKWRELLRTIINSCLKSYKEREVVINKKMS